MQPWMWVVGLFSLVILASLGFVAFKNRETTQAVEGRDLSTWLVWGTGLLGLSVTLYDWAVAREQAWTAVPLAVGTGLFVAGAAIRVLARRALGRFYTARLCILTGHQLITDGIYGTLRHPGYLGFLLWAAGVPLIFGSGIGLVVMLGGFTPALIYRIHREEALLRAHFGAAYADYAACTRRLIPFIY